MIKELLLSESYDDNKLAVNILRAKNYPEYQIKFIIIETVEYKNLNKYFDMWSMLFNTGKYYKLIV